MTSSHDIITVRYTQDVETTVAAHRTRFPRRRGRVGRRVALVRFLLFCFVGSAILFTISSAYLAWTEREFAWLLTTVSSAGLWWLIVKVWRSVRSRPAIRKALAERRLLGATVTMTASPSGGIRWDTPLGSVEIPWAGVMSWRESKGMFLIADCDGAIRFAPKSAFPSPQSVDDFRQLLQIHTV